MFYGPVWYGTTILLARHVRPNWLRCRLVILITLAIYARAGKEIFKKRQELRNVSQKRSYTVIENPFTSCKTTEVHISSEPARALRNDSQTSLCDDHGKPVRGYNPYTVSVGTGSAASQAPHARMASLARTPRRNHEANSAAWGYTKCAMLFFISLVITWVSPAPWEYAVQYPCLMNALLRSRSPRPSTVSTASFTPKRSVSPSATLPALSCLCKDSGTRSFTPWRRYPRVEPSTNHFAIADGSADAVRHRVQPRASSPAEDQIRFLMFYAPCRSAEALSDFHSYTWIDRRERGITDART